MKRRSRILRDLDAELGLEYRRQFLGETAEVLIESDARTSPTGLTGRKVCGRSERYFKIYLKNTQHKGPKNNDIIKVRLTESYRDGLLGIPL